SDGGHAHPLRPCAGRAGLDPQLRPPAERPREGGSCGGLVAPGAGRGTHRRRLGAEEAGMGGIPGVGDKLREGLAPGVAHRWGRGAAAQPSEVLSPSRTRVKIMRLSGGVEPLPVHDWTRVDPAIFHDFHLAWVAALQQEFNGGLLPPGCYVLIEQHAGRSIAEILPLPGSPAALPSRRTLAIRHVSGHRLVALVEVVSPAN